MKSKWIVWTVFPALSILFSCSKNSSDSGDPVDPDPGPKVDSSKCLLTGVHYLNEPLGIPYLQQTTYFYYDSLKRVTMRTGDQTDLYTYEPGKVTVRSYINSVVDSNLSQKYIYTLDYNGRVVTETIYSYFYPKSENDIRSQYKKGYEYNADGYLTSKKKYAPNQNLDEETKYFYQNGNLLKREIDHYDLSKNPSVKKGTDTITYTYDNTSYYPEAYYLYEINEQSFIQINRYNKNNIIAVQSKYYQPRSTWGEFATIQYTYYAKGPRLEKVDLTATSTTNFNFNSTITFDFNCR